MISNAVWIFEFRPINLKRVTIISIQAIICTKPHEPLRVLQDTPIGIT